MAAPLVGPIRQANQQSHTLKIRYTDVISLPPRLFLLKTDKKSGPVRVFSFGLPIAY
jgi:hypothetical protein